jgi:RNA polymerase sigma-70 factor (ECF subfamily)
MYVGVLFFFSQIDEKNEPFYRFKGTVIIMRLKMPKIEEEAAEKSNIQTDTDEMLFTAYCQGDAGAFEVLFRRYQARLCQHMERMLNDRQAGEDLVIETFLRIHRFRNEYRDGSSVRAWIYTIARNLARNWLKREKIRKWLPLTVRDPALETTEAPQVDEDEIQRRVAASFAKLPIRQREVCSLRLLGELSLEEIKQVVGVSQGTVKSRLFYGQRRLRELLADLNPGEELKG